MAARDLTLADLIEGKHLAGHLSAINHGDAKAIVDLQGVVRMVQAGVCQWGFESAIPSLAIHQ